MLFMEKKYPERFNLFWLNLLMTCIGEQFIGFEDQICGAIASVRDHANRVSFAGHLAAISYHLALDHSLGARR